MDQKRQRIEAIFEAAIGLGHPEERSAFLDRECAGDSALRAELESLLAAHDEENTFQPKAWSEAIRAHASEGDYGEIEVPNPRYDVGSQLARGGMGAILEARDLALNRTLAMKVILTGTTATK